MATKTKTPKKNKATGKTYPIIIHGPDAIKKKLRSLASARGVSMAKIVCDMIQRAQLTKPKAKKKAAAPKKPELTEGAHALAAA